MDDEGLGELEAGVEFGVSALGMAAGEDLLRIEAAHLADCRVCGEAILAGVRLGDGEGDLLAELCVEVAGGEGT